MVLVTGATGYTGRFLVRRLLEAGRTLRLLVRASSNLSGTDTGTVEAVVGDLERLHESPAIFAGVRSVIHLGGVEHAGAVCERVDGGVERVVVTSSLRRFSNVRSATVEKVIRGEEQLIESGVPGTILRPSMIFGPGNDRNISRLVSQLRRSRLMPVFGSGRCLMQPVYVGDLVTAIVACLDEPATLGRAYAIAGAAPLPYNELIEIIGAAKVSRRSKSTCRTQRCWPRSGVLSDAECGCR